MNIERINKKIINLSENDKFSGCILLNDKDRNVIYSYCCGYASKEYDIKNTLDTRFNIASVGKPITGVAITKLIEDQIINPSHFISEYINLKNDIFNNITIEQLLTHTSGLGDYFQQAFDSPHTKWYEEFNDFSDIIGKATLLFKPGEKWAYSNLGYLVLGLLVEKLTGMTYYSYISQNIFIPANMTDSGFWLYNEPVKNCASGYGYDEERGIWRNRTVIPVLRGNSSGGWFSTVDNLSKFMEAVLSNKLLSNCYTNAMITSKPELNAPNYGYGFFVTNEKLGHGGGGTGTSTQLSYYKESGCTLTVLCNYSIGANEVTSIIDDELLRIK